MTTAGTASNGNTVTYQWYKGASATDTVGTLIPGAVSATFVIPTDLSAGTYYYFCVLSAEDCADKKSSTATVTINKINWPGTTSVTKKVKANETNTDVVVNLPALPPSASYGTPVITAPANGLVVGESVTLSADYTTLTFNATSQPEGTTEVITLSVSNLTNYNNYTVTVNVLAEADSISITTQPTDIDTYYLSGAENQFTAAGTASNSNVVSYQWCKGTSLSDTNGVAIPGADEAVYAPEDVDAGTYYYYCVLSAAGCSDTKTNTASLVIAKINYSGAKTAVTTVEENGASTGNTVTLPALAPGGSYGAITVNGALIDGTPTLSGLVLSFDATSQPMGTEASITIAVTGCPNYNDYFVTVTVIADNRTLVTITAERAVDIVYDGTPRKGYTGDPGTDPAYSGTLEFIYTGINGTNYPASSTPPSNAGEYSLEIAVPSSDPLYLGSTTIEFTIGKRSASASPKNFTINSGSAMPTFALEYSGVIDGETLAPSAPAEFSCGAENTEVPGTYPITWSNIDSVHFDAYPNYNVTKTATGTLTIRTPIAPPNQPPTKPSGTISVEVIPETGAPLTGITNSSSEIGHIVLTAEDLARIAAGESAQVYITIEDIGDRVPTEDKTATEQLLEENADVVFGMYVDISLYKQLGSDDPTKVLLANGNLLISIEIPESLRQEDRVFDIVRVHNGTAQLLNGSYDGLTGILSFETDRFSTYAIVYAYEEVSLQDDVSLAEAEENPETPDDVIVNASEDDDELSPGTDDGAISESNEASAEKNPSTAAAVSLSPFGACAIALFLSRKKK